MGVRLILRRILQDRSQPTANVTMSDCYCHQFTASKLVITLNSDETITLQLHQQPPFFFFFSFW